MNPSHGINIKADPKDHHQHLTDFLTSLLDEAEPQLTIIGKNKDGIQAKTSFLSTISPTLRILISDINVSNTILLPDSSLVSIKNFISIVTNGFIDGLKIDDIASQENTL